VHRQQLHRRRRDNAFNPVFPLFQQYCCPGLVDFLERATWASTADSPLGDAASTRMFYAPRFVYFSEQARRNHLVLLKHQQIHQGAGNPGSRIWLNGDDAVISPDKSSRQKERREAEAFTQRDSGQSAHPVSQNENLRHSWRELLHETQGAAYKYR